MNKNERRAKFFADIGSMVSSLDRRGIKLMPTYYYRTAAKQLLLRARGASKVTRSMHQDWLAMDFVLLKNGQPFWADCEEYNLAGKMWEALGGVWGGRWKDPHDIYHFQAGPGED